MTSQDPEKIEYLAVQLHHSTASLRDIGLEDVADIVGRAVNALNRRLYGIALPPRPAVHLVTPKKLKTEPQPDAATARGLRRAHR